MHTAGRDGLIQIVSTKRIGSWMIAEGVVICPLFGNSRTNAAGCEHPDRQQNDANGEVQLTWWIHGRSHESHDGGQDAQARIEEFHEVTGGQWFSKSELKKRRMSKCKSPQFCQQRRSVFFCSRYDAVVFHIMQTVAVVGKINSTIGHFNQSWTNVNNGGNVENIPGERPGLRQNGYFVAAF